MNTKMALGVLPRATTDYITNRPGAKNFILKVTITTRTQGLNSVSKARLRLGQHFAVIQYSCRGLHPFFFFKCEEMVVEGGLKTISLWHRFINWYEMDAIALATPPVEVGIKSSIFMALMRY